MFIQIVLQALVDLLSDIGARLVMSYLQSLVMVHNLLDPWSTGSSECSKGRQSVLVTLNVKRNKMGRESGGLL